MAIGLDDETSDLVVAELTAHIKKLEAKRLQLIYRRSTGIDRTQLLDIIGSDTKAAEEILTILDHFEEVPELLRLALDGSASITAAAKLAQAVDAIPAAVVAADLDELKTWITTLSLADIATNLRRWRRLKLAELGQPHV